MNQVNKLVDKMDAEDRARLGLDSDSPYQSYEEGSRIAKRVVKRKNGFITSFADAFEQPGGNVSIAVATSKDSAGQGYASANVQKLVDWFKKNKQQLGYNELLYSARVDNTASNRVARKAGFILRESFESGDYIWNEYVYPN